MTRADPQPSPDRSRLVIELIAMAMGCLLAAVTMRFLFAGEATQFEDLALGAATTSVFANLDGQAIHCGGVIGSGSVPAEACIDGVRARGADAVAVWLGNSQIHAINQMQPGDETATPMLHRRLRRSGLDLVAFSLPNSNLEELYLLFTWLQPRLPIRQLVIPVTFDDLRESKIREDVGLGLGDPETAEALRRTDSGRRIIARYESESGGDLAALDQTIQERSEAALGDWLERHSALWDLRAEARGKIFHRLHIWRNAVFGITPQSKRRMIEGLYRDNLAALEAMLDAAGAADIDAIVYVPPLRSDVETPYVESEYQRFKADVEAIAAKGGARFANLEDLVPAHFWGTTSSPVGNREAQIDFMHFQAGGHELLANALGDLIEAEIREEPR